MGRSAENLSYDYAHSAYNVPLQFFPQFFIPQSARYAVMDTRFYKKQQLYRALVLILGNIRFTYHAQVVVVY
jgi:hypothetical protein